MTQHESTNGQWVIFRLANPDATDIIVGGRYEQPAPGELAPVLAGCHQTADGYYVGIYQKPGTDSRGELLPLAIVPVKRDSGHNVRFVFGDQFIQLQLPPHALKELQPRRSKHDIPPGRLATTSAEFRDDVPDSPGEPSPRKLRELKELAILAHEAAAAAP